MAPRQGKRNTPSKAGPEILGREGSWTSLPSTGAAKSQKTNNGCSSEKWPTVILSVSAPLLWHTDRYRNTHKHMRKIFYITTPHAHHDQHHFELTLHATVHQRHTRITPFLHLIHLLDSCCLGNVVQIATLFQVAIAPALKTLSFLITY